MSGKEKNVVISERLKALCQMVTPGSTVVDVGCDHGFVPIYLVQRGLSPKVIATDVRKGPLSRAREHIAAYGLEDYIETRLGDGLSACREGEAQSLVCAGMGGRLMQRILTEGKDKTAKMKELILQPQSEIAEFRRFLREAGYETLQENILWEEGKYYFLMKVSPSEGILPAGGRAAKETDPFRQELYDRYGRELLENRHPVLKRYLQDSLKTAGQIREALSGNEKEKARERLGEITVEIRFLQEALAWFDRDHRK